MSPVFQLEVLIIIVVHLADEAIHVRWGTPTSERN